MAENQWQLGNGKEPVAVSQRQGVSSRKSVARSQGQSVSGSQLVVGSQWRNIIKNHTICDISSIIFVLP